VFTLSAGQFSSRFRSGEFLLERRDAVFGFGQRDLQTLQLCPALGAIFLDLCGQAGEVGQLGFFFFQLPLDFCDGVVGLLDLSGMLLTFFSRVTDVAPRALDQLGKFFRTQPIELNAAAVRGDFTFQSLHLRTRIGDQNVDLVQRVACFG